MSNYNFPYKDSLLTATQEAESKLDIVSQTTASKMHTLKIAQVPNCPKSGIKAIDCYLDAFLPGSISVLGAETSAGKTTLASNIAANIAYHQKKEVLFFALESGDSVANLVRCHINQKSDTDMTDEERHSDIPNFKYIIPTGGTAITLKTVERAIYETNPKFVVLDHIHYLLQTGEKNVQSYIGSTVRNLALMAQKYKTHILIVSHLRKPSRDEDNGVPAMSRLKDSSALYQDPSIVLLLARKRISPELLEPGEEAFAPSGVVFVAKNRDFGKTGIARFTYMRNYHSFKFEEVK